MSDNADGVAVSAMYALVDDPDSICIIRECRELEAAYHLKYTDSILCGADSVCLQQIKKEVLQADNTQLLDLCISKAPLIAKVVKDGGSWPALWDSVRHLDSRHTIGLQHLSRILALHGRESKPCPLCDQQLSSDSLTDHILTLHEATSISLASQLRLYWSTYSGEKFTFYIQIYNIFLTHFNPILSCIYHSSFFAPCRVKQ